MSILQDYRTGLRDVDAANEGLCFVIERIFDPLVECRRRHGGCDHSACTKIGAILKYAGRNFASHEALMAEGNYPLSAEHSLDHARLIQELESMQASRVCGDRDRTLVRDFVTRWTSRHVHGCDRPLGDWVATRGCRAGE
ncbi:MAG TPA: hypothetical protein VLL76_08185 [Candidatus Omnitrophota bacterium]|nr:hypothetical protein [Candidatus Omnitrophota bacterium]